jgi:hypothetical protein
MSAKKKTAAGDDAGTSEPSTFDELKEHPAVIAFLNKQIANSDQELKQGPGGNWAYNESKRKGVEAINRFLHLLAGE